MIPARSPMGRTARTLGPTRSAQAAQPLRFSFDGASHRLARLCLWGALSSLPMLVVACGSDETSNGAGGAAGQSASGGSGGQGGSGGKAGAGGSSSAGGAAGQSSAGGKGGASAQGGAAGSSDPGTPLTFSVDVSKDNHAISPYIYCLNAWNSSSDDMAKLAQSNGLRLVRSGGNRFSAYNWENNASNAGADYQFQNDDYFGTSTVPGAAFEATLATADSGSIAALITGQLGDYVSADKDGGGDVTKTADYLAKRFKKNVYSKSGTLANPPDTTDDSVYQQEFLGWVQSAHAKAKVLVSLDNEADLWGSTHKEIWPTAPSYDDFIKRNTDYATMARGQFPAAEVLGFASFGWYGWRTFTGAYKDGDFLNYYLDKMKAAEGTAGKRLIDYVDLHWYPEANVGGDKNTRIILGGTSADEVTAREQAPRSLWDSSYVESSWISDGLKTDEPDSKGAINLIPRIKKQIADHYPGTKLAIGEWSYGADAHISGAIATADVLGIFGRDSVDLACNFYANPDFVFRDGAFQLFGNYDSKGAHFGDTSVSAQATDPALTSIYAAKDAADAKRLTLVVINKDSAPHVAKISIASDAQYKSAAVYVLSAAAVDTYNKTAHPQGAPAVTTTTANQLSISLPAQSVVMVVPSAEPSAPSGSAWPTPAVVTEKGWSFDKDVEGWKLDKQDPSDFGATLSWDASEGKPKAGALAVQCPFTARKQQAQITMANQALDLTGKKLQMNVRRKGAFDGGIMFFAGSAKSTSWVMAGWSMLPSEDWTTIVLDPVAVQEKNPDFDPKAVTYLGAIFATGDAGSTPLGNVTFCVDQVVVVSAN
jgi:hypothetical protein